MSVNFVRVGGTKNVSLSRGAWQRILRTTELKKPIKTKFKKKQNNQHLHLHSRTWSWRSPSHSPCERTDDWSGGWRTSRHLCSWWSSTWPARGTTMTWKVKYRFIITRRAGNNGWDHSQREQLSLVVRILETHLKPLLDSCFATWAKWTD